MRLYLSKKEASTVIEVLETCVNKHEPEIEAVVNRMKRCEELQKRSKRKPT